MSKKYLLIVILVLLLTVFAGAGIFAYLYLGNSKATPTSKNVDSTIEAKDANEIIFFDWDANSLRIEQADTSTEGYYLLGEVWVKNSNPELGSRELGLNDQGEDVKVLQNAINRFKAVNQLGDTQEGLEITGIYNLATQDAISEVQKSLALTMSGRADQDLQRLLVSSIGDSVNKEEK